MSIDVSHIASVSDDPKEKFAIDFSEVVLIHYLTDQLIIRFKSCSYRVSGGPACQKIWGAYADWLNSNRGKPK